MDTNIKKQIFKTWKVCAHLQFLLCCFFLLSFPSFAHSQVFHVKQLTDRIYQIDFQLRNLRFDKVEIRDRQNGGTLHTAVIPQFESGIILALPGAPLPPQTGFSLADPSAGKPTIKILTKKIEPALNIEVAFYPDTSYAQLSNRTSLDSSVVSYGGRQVFRGVPLHSFQIKPFRYDESKKKLSIYSRISLLVEFTAAENGSILQQKIAGSQLQGIVLNADQLRAPAKKKLLHKKSEDWRVSGQTYLKISLHQDGLYRISYAGLLQTGVQPDGINPNNFAVFYKGQPYPVFVSGEPDGVFDAQDYIEFYGRRNPGQNQFYNDYSDTSVYWLTWGGNPGLRVQHRDIAPKTGTTPTAFYQTTHREEDKLYYSGDNNLAVFNSDKTPGEGWIWARIYAGDEFTYNVMALNYADSPLPDSLKIKVHGFTNDAVQPDHHLQILVNNKYVSDFYFEGVGDYFYRCEIPKGIVKLGENHVTLRSLGDTGAQYDVLYLDWFELSYPRIFIAADNRLFFSFPDSLQGRIASVDITNFHQNSVTVYDISSLTKLDDFKIVPYADKFYISLSDTVRTGKKYVAFADAAALSPDRMVVAKPIELRGPAHQADYLIITNRKFRQQADELAQYRRQTQGLKPFVAEVEQIFDEFNFGSIDPLALRDFIRYAAENWRKPAPRFVLFFGDASWDYKKNSGSSVKENYVPTYGNPVSDSRLVSIDGDNDFLPDLFAGRIAVESQQEAEQVIAKIRAYESSPYSDWQKNVIFLNGGFDDWEQNLFKNQSEALIRDFVAPAPFGGNPVRIYKEADGLIVGELRSEILPAINRGALWLSFLGHAGSETWDLMLRNEDIFQLKNGDRLPFITSMTCHTARFANPVITSFGELFVKVPEKGAVAFWGTTGWGYIFQDKVLIDELFKLMLQEGVNSFGEATTRTKLFLWSLLGDSPINRSTIDQYTLLGDPAMKLRLPEQPDFAIDRKNVLLYPEQPTENDTSMRVDLTLHNFGLVPEDSVTVRLDLIPHAAGFAAVQKIVKIAPPLYETKLLVPLKLNRFVGNVKLKVTLDPENRIAEIYEDNNSAELNFYIYSTSISLSKPPPFSLLSQSQPTLQVYSPESGGENERFYYFNLDTTPDFNSDFLINSGELPEGTIVTKWQPPANLSPGAWFWRCRMSDGGQFSRWLQSTFSVATQPSSFAWRQDDGTGFSLTGQSHLFLKNGAVQLKKDPGNFIHLEVQSAGHDDGNRCYLIVNFKIVSSGGRGQNVVALEPSGKIIAGPENFDTYADSSAADRMADFISAQPENALFLIGIRDDGFFSMTEKGYRALESIGSLYCRNVGFRDSWAMIGKKGALPGTVPEIWQPKGSGTAVARDTLALYFYPQGTLASGEIGPATSWQQVSWNVEVAEPGTRFRLRVDAFNRQTQKWELYREIEHGGRLSLQDLPAQIYTKIKCEMALFSDDALHTPKFYNWQVSYRPPPDLTTHPALFSFAADSVLEGTPLRVTVPVFNVGMANADSVALKFELLTDESGWTPAADASIPLIKTDDSVHVTVNLPTAGNVGIRKFRVTIDPQNRWNEILETNNQYAASFFVRSDSVRPVVSISFDDRDILPGDLVSSEPDIEIQVKDNSLLAIADTALVQLFLDSRPVYYGLNQDILEFQSVASGPENGSAASVHFRPKLKSGQHVLEVIAKDATQNVAYNRADFIVETDFSLQNVLNVPNPFRDETHFTYILTQPAQSVTLSVFTVTGRLILRRQDLPGNVGFNSYRWDGLDADGDPLANGTYLYKIRAGSAKETVSQIGKLVVMR